MQIVRIKRYFGFLSKVDPYQNSEKPTSFFLNRFQYNNSSTCIYSIFYCFSLQVFNNSLSTLNHFYAIYCPLTIPILSIDKINGKRGNKTGGVHITVILLTDSCFSYRLSPSRWNKLWTNTNKYMIILAMNKQGILSFFTPNICLALGAVAISFSGVWVTLAEVSSTTSAFYRVFFGSLFLFVIFLKNREKLSDSKPHLPLAALCGLLFAFDLFCWHRSINLVGPGLATLLGNFQVFILAGVGVLILKERYNKRLFGAIPLAILGLFLIVGLEWSRVDGDYRLGVYYGLATAVFYSGYILSLKRLYSTRCGIITVMLMVSLSTALFLGTSILFTGNSFRIPDLFSLLSLAGLGLFSQCIGWLLIAVSLPKTRTSSAALILLLQPSLSFVWDVLFFARPTNALNWLGVILTISAIYLGVRAKKD